MSNLMDGLSFSISSVEDFGRLDIARQLVECFLNAPSAIRPTRFGANQPNMQVITERTRLDQIVSFLAPKDRPSAPKGPVKLPDGLLLFEFPGGGEYLIHWKKDVVPRFSGISGAIPWSKLSTSAQTQESLDLITQLSGIANGVYGDVQNMRYSGWDTPLDLQKRLPDVPWVSIYGRPYIELFTAERIQTAPFWKVQLLQSGHFLLHATDSPHSPVPEAIKSAIRQHLGEDSFMSGGRWRYKTGRAPRFDFSKVLIR